VGQGAGLGQADFRLHTPVPIYSPEPEYSEEARKAKFQGSVMLRVEIDASGRVSNAHVVKHLGLGLDQKAIDAALQWRFKPGTLDGKAVTVESMIEINFRLL
jgi:TonB family protein